MEVVGDTTAKPKPLPVTRLEAAAGKDATTVAQMAAAKRRAKRMAGSGWKERSTSAFRPPILAYEASITRGVQMVCRPWRMFDSKMDVVKSRRQRTWMLRRSSSRSTGLRGHLVREGDPAVHVEQRAGRDDWLGVRRVEAGGLTREGDGHASACCDACWPDVRAGSAPQPVRPEQRQSESRSQKPRAAVKRSRSPGESARGGFLWIASVVLLFDKRGVMRITVSGREQAEVAAGEDAGERRTRFCFADRLAPCLDCDLRPDTPGRSAAACSPAAFEGGEIAARPNRRRGVPMASMTSGGRTPKTPGLRAAAQSRGKCGVRRLGDAQPREGSAHGGVRWVFSNAVPCVLSGCSVAARVVDAEDHAGLDAEVRGLRMCGLFG